MISGEPQNVTITLNDYKKFSSIKVQSSCYRNMTKVYNVPMSSL